MNQKLSKQKCNLDLKLEQLQQLNSHCQIRKPSQLTAILSTNNVATYFVKGGAGNSDLRETYGIQDGADMFLNPEEVNYAYTRNLISS
jgi:hypothetical protein